ncbi:hypothetical protein N9L18_00330 [Candidatus Pacebacteria bacterium]|nr:hypothetical protein [Candidatus Paceibacterota bacterium]
MKLIFVKNRNENIKEFNLVDFDKKIGVFQLRHIPTKSSVMTDGLEYILN